MPPSDACHCPACAPGLAPDPATASPATFFAHLAQLVETTRNSLGLELENLLEPVVLHCDTVCAVALPSSAEAEHARQLRQAIDALLRYDAQSEQLLAYYRYALSLTPPPALPTPLSPELAAHLDHLRKLAAIGALPDPTFQPYPQPGATVPTSA